MGGAGACDVAESGRWLSRCSSEVEEEAGAGDDIEAEVRVRRREGGGHAQKAVSGSVLQVSSVGVEAAMVLALWCGGGDSD